MSAEDLSPEQIAALQKFKEDLEVYKQRLENGEHDGYPISKRGRMEYKLKHGLPLDEPLPNELIVPRQVSDILGSQTSNARDNQVVKDMLLEDLRAFATASGAIKEMLRQHRAASQKIKDEQDGQGKSQTKKFQDSWYPGK